MPGLLSAAGFAGQVLPPVGRDPRLPALIARILGLLHPELRVRLAAIHVQQGRLDDALRYLGGKLRFPFMARVVVEQDSGPLKLDMQVEVRELSGIDPDYLDRNQRHAQQRHAKGEPELWLPGCGHGRPRFVLADGVRLRYPGRIRTGSR